MVMIVTMVGMRGNPCNHLYQICHPLSGKYKWKCNVEEKECITGVWCPIKGDSKHQVVK